MKRYRVRKSGPLRGTIRVPGDKSIGHRALIFGALARGTSRVSGLSGGLDNLATAEAFRAMGVTMTLDGSRAEIEGVGLRGLRMPDRVIDCGNSGTTMRLLAGLLSAQRFGSRLVGDHSLMRRPMGRVIEPLRARGAHIAGSAGAKEGVLYPPISIAPLVEGESLTGMEYVMPVASAQVKSALLFSGLYASGPTMLREPELSRDHTERMMLSLGVPIESMGNVVVLDPTRPWANGWDAFTWEVPGDPSSAAFPIIAAAIIPGSEVTVEGVCTNPTRTGLFDLMRLMNAGPSYEPRGEGAGGEPVTALTMRHTTARGSLAAGEIIVRMIDEVPILCALAAAANGRTEVRDAKELRVKESDRIAVMANALRGFGVTCEELEDGLVVEGGAKQHANRVESHGDHRIAMTAAILGMISEGETIVDDAECVDTSFPGFVDLFRSLGADIEVENV